MRIEDLLPVESDEHDQFGSGDKRIVRASVTVEIRELGPNKRILSIRTRDGWLYRFQRFGRNEPLVRFDRERPDGTKLTGRGGTLPRSVEQYAEAVEADEIEDVPGQVLDVEARPTSGPQTALTDGGEQAEARLGTCQECPRRLPADSLEAGRCPLCFEAEQRKHRERDRHLSAHPIYDDPTPRHDYGDQQ